MSLSNTAFALFAEVDASVATSNTATATPSEAVAAAGADTTTQTSTVPSVTGEADTTTQTSTSTEVPSGPLPEDSSSAPVQDSGMFSWIVMIVAFFCIMWFFMIRPQQSQQKKFNKMIEDLKPGDKVVTIGGINASVTQIIREKNMVQLLIDDKSNVKVMFDTRAIAYVVTPEETQK